MWWVRTAWGRKGERQGQPAGSAEPGILEIAFAGLSGVLGAGFASGREAALFFAGFGAFGLWGVALAGGLITAVSWLVLDLARRTDSGEYRELLARVLPRGLVDLIDAVLLGLLWGTLAIMVAGAGEIVSEAVPVPTWLSAAVLCLTAWACLRAGAGRFTRLSGILSPIIIGSCLVVAAGYLVISGVTGQPPELTGRLSRILLQPVSAQVMGAISPRAWYTAALLYASYNSALLTTIFATMGERIHSRSVPMLGGLLCGAVLVALLMSVSVAIWRGGAGVIEAPMPMLRLAAALSRPFAHLFGLVLLVALFSATLANGCALAARLSEWVAWPVALGLSLAGAWAAGLLGFRELVGLVYPFFGWLWLGALPGLALERFRSTGGDPPRQGFVRRRLTNIAISRAHGVSGGKRR